MEFLKQQGFRCIPITSAIPDIIAFKDGKVFAVEVEVLRTVGTSPNWNKYTDDIRQHFDDIIWILIRKNKREVVRG